MNKVQNGKVWVKDPRKKGGGYWRRIGRGARRVGGAIASQLLGAVAIGAGTAVVANHALKTAKKEIGGKTSGVSREVATTFGKQVNRGAIASAAVGGLVVGAAGANAIAKHKQRRTNA